MALLSPDQFMIEVDTTRDPAVGTLVLRCLHPDCQRPTTEFRVWMGSGQLLSALHLKAGDHINTVHRRHVVTL